MSDRRKKRNRFEPSDQLEAQFDEAIKKATIQITSDIKNELLRSVLRKESAWMSIVKGIIASLVAAFLWWLIMETKPSQSDNAVAKIEKITIIR